MLRNQKNNCIIFAPLAVIPSRGKVWSKIQILSSGFSKCTLYIGNVIETENPKYPFRNSSIIRTLVILDLYNF